jgi:hypothetical protein
MADGVNKGGRNQRTWDFSMGTHVFRVIAYEKVKIEKEAFSTINPEKDMIGKVEDLSLFQEWLASRYFRQTLPDCINQKTVSALCCYETANKAFKLIFTPYNGTNLGIALPSA